MRLFFTILLGLSFSVAFANDNEFSGTSKALNAAFSESKTETVKPVKEESSTPVISLRSMPLPTENKHQFRYLFKRYC